MFQAYFGLSLLTALFVLRSVLICRVPVSLMFVVWNTLPSVGGQALQIQASTPSMAGE